MFGKLAPALALAAASTIALAAIEPSGGAAAKGLTAVAGLTVGHHTLTERPTGCTVILTGAEGVIAGVDVRGGAPGTRDIELLDPSNSVERVHAIVLSGGSAFGLDAAALVAVNAVGDIIDPATGKVIAGTRTADGTALADARLLLRSGAAFTARPGENTTLGVVATNATLTKAQARKVAQMAHDGFARAISPIHTPADGDTIFALATGERPGEPNVLLIGALA